MKIIISILSILFLLRGVCYPTWVEQYASPTPPRLNSVSCDMNAQYGWIGGDNGTVLFTSNSGQNWNYKNSSLFANNNINVISYMQSNIALCSSTGSTATYIYRTTDMGNSWNIVYQQANGRIRDIKMYDAVTGYAYGDPINGRWTLLKTTNAGLTFDSSGMYVQQSGGETGFYNAMFVVYQYNYIFFGTNNSKIYMSTNAGNLWSFINMPFQNIKTITFGDFVFNYGYAGGSGAVRSTNRGASWQSLTLPGTGDCNAFTNDGYQYVMRSAFYCKTSQIYLSNDGGQNFILNYTSPNGGNYTHMHINAIDIDVYFRHGWAVRDNGGISRYDSTINTGIKKIGSDIPGKFFLFQNYPNPFNPTTKIKFNIPNISPPLIQGGQGGLTTLRVYDLLGREVTTLVNEKLNPGSYEVEWDASKFASGIYFYKLISEKFNQTKKLILVK